jgi:hypothetical protein
MLKIRITYKNGKELVLNLAHVSVREVVEMAKLCEVEKVEYFRG